MLHRLLRIPLSRYKLFAEALLQLGTARLALACLPYRCFERTIAETGKMEPGQRETEVREIGFAIRRIASVVPWRSDCLIQAAAARWMLRRRNIVSQVHIGVTNAAGSLSAHAWTTCGARFVTGSAGHKGFQAIRII